MKKEKPKTPKQALEDALLKKALGYDSDEIIEEYAVDEEGNYKLIKKKITKKYISPDITSAKLLLEKMELENNSFENMSDEQLLARKKELLKLLKEGE